MYSHILGQVDYDNYGISGVEKYFDKELKDKKLLSSPLQLTLDTNIQHIVDDELNKALKIFNATGGGSRYQATGHYLDSPSTTSSQQYSIVGINIGGVNMRYGAGANNPITLIEIGA